MTAERGSERDAAGEKGRSAAKRKTLTGAKKKYIRGANYAIMKKRQEGMRHEEKRDA